MVYVEPKDQEGVMIHPTKLGRELCNHKVADITKISNKGKRRMAVQFKTATAANHYSSLTVRDKNAVHSKGMPFIWRKKLVKCACVKTFAVKRPEAV